MNVVVDTNIIISMLSKQDGAIFDMFSFLHQQNHQLYLSDYTLLEISKHNNRILKYSKFNLQELENLKAVYLQKLSVIPFHFIPEEVRIDAYLLTKDIDENDTSFIATAIFVKGFLWTGDKVLYTGLKNKGFVNILNTKDLREII